MKELQPKLNQDDKDLMEKLLSAGHIKYKYAVRLQTVLLRAKSKRTDEICDFLGIHKCTVSLYINRYNELGIDALLKDKTRKPGTEPISQELINEVIQIACNEKPKNETHWSSRSLAKKVGLSHTKVSQILNEHGIKPHLTKKRTYSNDLDLKAKLKDV